MKRKVWKWIFIIFVVCVIVVIATTLVLSNKSDDADDSLDDSNSSSSTESTEVYATSFAVSLPETIQILLGTSAKLLDGYISVAPSSMLNELTYEITPKSDGVVNGVVLTNNVLTANSLGTYTIKFKMPKSKQTFFSKSINVLVYEEQTSCHIQQIKNVMTVGEALNLNQIFEIMEGKTFSVTTDGKTTYSNEIITAQTVGESEIKFSFIETNVEYVYTFKLTIKDEPLYQIIVDKTAIDIDISEDDVAFITFSVINRNEENVSQDIVAVSSDTNIVIIERIESPMIKLRALSEGEATITISLLADSTITVEVKIIVN